jgi:hypothetical protein
MVYVKHPQHGNKHVSAEEAAVLVQEGWVIWPRTKEQKAGIVAPVPVQEPDAVTPAKRKPGRPRKGT